MKTFKKYFTFRPLTFLVIFSLTILCFTDCKKKLGTSWVYFDETGCLYPWGNFKQDGSDDQQIMDAVKSKFKDLNVKIVDIKILSDGNPDNLTLCTACHCITGRRVHCEVKNKDIGTMKSNGFYQ